MYRKTNSENSLSIPGLTRNVLKELLACFIICLVAWTSRAEIKLQERGYPWQNGEGTHGHGNVLNMARQGTFFSTTDFGFVKGEADKRLNPKRSVLGQLERFPGNIYGTRIPWISNGEKTLFGVTFQKPFTPKYPGMLDHFKDNKVLFDRIVIHWGEEVPALNTWRACVLTADNELKRLPVPNKKLYPHDRTTITFEPTTIKTFFVAVKGGRGGAKNFASVANIRIYMTPSPSLVKSESRVMIFQPDLYKISFAMKNRGGMRLSSAAPTIIDNIQAVSVYSGAPVTHQGKDIFSKVIPFIDFNGKRIFPLDKDYAVTPQSDAGCDTLSFELDFKLPNNQETRVPVKVICDDSDKDHIAFHVGANALPDGAKIGCQMFSTDELFKAYIPKSTNVVSNIENGKTFDTIAGPVGIKTSKGCVLKMNKTTLNEKLYKRDTSEKKVKFDFTSNAGPLDITLSLPVGPDGAPHAKTLSYKRYDSPANAGAEGVAPFKMEDLELLEEIDCANPNGEYAFYDVANDPLIKSLVKKHGPLKTTYSPGCPYGYLPFWNEPDKGAVPLQNVLGDSCRVINDNRGTYFRYDLKTKFHGKDGYLEPGAYLVQIEHAFDKRRRGTFNVFARNEKENLKVPILIGGFDTGSAPYDKKLKTESVFCHITPQQSYMTFSDKNAYSICLTNTWSWGGWKKDPGLAVKKIRIYKVKNLPVIPNIRDLIPEKNPRSITALTENGTPWMLYQFPGLVGYNALWCYSSTTYKFLSGNHVRTLTSEMPPGSLKGYEFLLKAGAEQGLFFDIHLGVLLRLGFGDTDNDSFTSSFHYSYNGNSIPFSPTKDELNRIAGALKNALPKLVKYSSFRDVSLADDIEPPAMWTRRNLEDFCRETGVTIDITPGYIENVTTLLNSDKTILDKWVKWACEKRYKFNNWLLTELRKYKKDVFITLNRQWYANALTRYYDGEKNPGIKGFPRAELAKRGIHDYIDFIKLMGIDPDMYVGDDGFCFAIETDARLRKQEADKIKRCGPSDIPFYYHAAWFKRLYHDFAVGGLSVMINSMYDESPKPFCSWSLVWMKSKREFREDLINALLYANARNITLPTYRAPWTGRISDFRKFAVPYRLLPFAPPEDFEGKLTDTASQALIHKYGDRYGLINVGPSANEVTLQLPPGKSSVIDLSNGFRQPLTVFKNEFDFPCVKIPMEEWSLNTLEVK